MTMLGASRSVQAATQRWQQEGEMRSRVAQEKIMKQLQAAQDQARQATEQRYQQALATSRAAADRMRARFGTARAGVAEMGKTAEADISRGAVQSLAQQQQALIGSGLAGTTMQMAAARGTEEDRRRAMERVAEQRRGALAGIDIQQAGAEMQAGGALTGLMASRQDVGPDMGMYAGLLQQAGAAPQRRVIGGGMGATAAAGRTAFGTPFQYFGSQPKRAAKKPRPQARAWKGGKEVQS